MLLVPSPPVLFDETIDRGSDPKSTGLSLPQIGPKSLQFCKSLHFKHSWYVHTPKPTQQAKLVYKMLYIFKTSLYSL